MWRIFCQRHTRRHFPLATGWCSLTQRRASGQCQDPLGQPLQERTSTSVATTRRTGTTATYCQRQTLSKCIHGPMFLLLARGLFVRFDPSATWNDVSLLLSGISGGSRFHVTQKRDRAKEGRNWSGSGYRTAKNALNDGEPMGQQNTGTEIRMHCTL